MKDREVGCRNLRAGKEEYPQNEGFGEGILQFVDLKKRNPQNDELRNGKCAN